MSDTDEIVVEDDGRIAPKFPKYQHYSIAHAWKKQQTAAGVTNPNFEVFKRENGDGYRQHSEYLAAEEEFKVQREETEASVAAWCKDYPRAYIARLLSCMPQVALMTQRSVSDPIQSIKRARFTIRDALEDIEDALESLEDQDRV